MGRKEDIAVVSLNTYGVPFLSPNPTERFNAVSRELEQMKIDIINFQEVHTYQLLRLLKEKLQAFPYIAYERSFFGAKGGLVSFSKIPFESVSFIPFTPIQRKSFRTLRPSLDSLREKGSLVSKFKDMPLVIINTHLSANKDGDWSQDNRYYPTHEAEIEHLSKLIHNSSGKGNGVIIAGDFNIAKDSELYTKFIHSSSALDAFGDDLHPTFRSEFLPKGRRAHCIDYIFYYSDTNGIEIRQTSFLFEGKTILTDDKEGFISDHIGLLAKLGVDLSYQMKQPN